MAHLFLRDVRAISSESRRPRLKKDYDALMKGDTFTVAWEEQFARGFEAYFMEST